MRSNSPQRTFALSEIVTRSLQMPQVTPQRVYLNVIRIGNSLVLGFHGQDESGWCFQVAALGKIAALIAGSAMTLDLLVAYWRWIASSANWDPIVQWKINDIKDNSLAKVWNYFFQERLFLWNSKKYFLQIEFFFLN